MRFSNTVLPRNIVHASDITKELMCTVRMILGWQNRSQCQQPFLFRSRESCLLACQLLQLAGCCSSFNQIVKLAVRRSAATEMSFLCYSQTMAAKVAGEQKRQGAHPASPCSLLFAPSVFVVPTAAVVTTRRRRPCSMHYNDSSTQLPIPSHPS